MAEQRKGRGAPSNSEGRFERHRIEPFDDGWGSLDEAYLDRQAQPAPKTEIFKDRNRTILTTNRSPDIPFDQSINPYQGCEHGCIYCYARPSHNYWGLSSGLDFERKIFAKQNAPGLLAEALAKPGYRCSVISLGANTDPYQPVERRMMITRSVLEVLAATKHPTAIVTKSAGVVRDIDLLQAMAADQLVTVYLSITSLDPEIVRIMEPRASAPHARLRAVRQLRQAGIPVGVMVAPVIPGLTDPEIEHILAAAADAGALQANYTFVRLAHDLKILFEEWLHAHHPGRAKHILSLIEQSRMGKRNDPRFHHRMRGEGVFADLIAQRFDKARRKYGLKKRLLPARTDLFKPPNINGQGELFA